MASFEELLDEAFGVRQLKRAKTRLKRSKVGEAPADAAAELVDVPNVSHFADKPSQRATQ